MPNELTIFLIGAAVNLAAAAPEGAQPVLS